MNFNTNNQSNQHKRQTDLMYFEEISIRKIRKCN